MLSYPYLVLPLRKGEGGERKWTAISDFRTTLATDLEKLEGEFRYSYEDDEMRDCQHEHVFWEIQICNSWYSVCMGRNGPVLRQTLGRNLNMSNPFGWSMEVSRSFG
jgi:hypothetical protein